MLITSTIFFYLKYYYRKPDNYRFNDYLHHMVHLVRESILYPHHPSQFSDYCNFSILQERNDQIKDLQILVEMQSQQGM